MLPVMKSPAEQVDHRKNLFRERGANKHQGKDLNKTEKKRDRLKKKEVVVAGAVFGMALLFCAQGARAAALASDNGSLYQNPGGRLIPKASRQWNPSTLGPPSDACERYLLERE
jgi:hypothetical protein